MRLSKKLMCAGGLLAAGLMPGQTAPPAVVRIGVTAPVYASGSAGQTAEALRTLEMQVLKSANVEVVKLDALTGDGVDYVLATTVNQEKAKGGFGGLKGLNALRQMSPVVPGAGLTKAATILQGAQMAADVASGITAKSEITLGYSLTTRSGQQVLNGVEKAKAKSDGDDVITPMVQAAAAKITAAAKR